MVQLKDLVSRFVLLKGHLSDHGNSVLFSSNTPTKQFELFTPNPHLFDISEFEKDNFLKRIPSFEYTRDLDVNFKPHFFSCSFVKPVAADMHVNVLATTQKEYISELSKMKLWLKKHYFKKNYDELRSYQLHVRNSFTLVRSLKNLPYVSNKKEHLQSQIVNYIDQQTNGITHGYSEDVAYLKKHSRTYFPEKTINHLNGVFSDDLVKKYPFIVSDILKSLYEKHLSQELKPGWKTNSKTIISDIDEHIESSLNDYLY